MIYGGDHPIQNNGGVKFFPTLSLFFLSGQEMFLFCHEFTWQRNVIVIYLHYQMQIKKNSHSKKEY